MTSYLGIPITTRTIDIGGVPAIVVEGSCIADGVEHDFVSRTPLDQFTVEFETRRNGECFDSVGRVFYNPIFSMPKTCGSKQQLERLLKEYWARPQSLPASFVPGRYMSLVGVGCSDEIPSVVPQSSIEEADTPIIVSSIE